VCTANLTLGMSLDISGSLRQVIQHHESLQYRPRRATCDNCAKQYIDTESDSLPASPSVSPASGRPRGRHWGEPPASPITGSLLILPGPAQPLASSACDPSILGIRRFASDLSSQSSGSLHRTADCLCGEPRCRCFCTTESPSFVPSDPPKNNSSATPRKAKFCSPECGWSHHVRTNDVNARKRIRQNSGSEDTAAGAEPISH